MVTIQRRYIPKSDCPKWDEQVQTLLPLHITSRGTIEAEGTGFLQVDFANKYFIFLWSILYYTRLIFVIIKI